MGISNGMVIYLHGALDSGLGVVSAQCSPGGVIFNECAKRNLELRAPTTLFPQDWNRGPQHDEVLSIAKEAQGKRPVYLAGHSMGGRGALMIALRTAPGLFKAVGAIAPALAQGLLDKPALILSDPFHPDDMRRELAASPLPAFLAYSPIDMVVSLRPMDFSGIPSDQPRRVVRTHFSLHNLLVGETAAELLDFFVGLP